MAYPIPTSPFTAMAIFFAGGNVNSSLQKIFDMVLVWQKEHLHIFGVSEYDFQGAFFQLAYREGLVNVSDDDVLEKLGELKLISFIPLMLKYHDVYFNDEGENWYNHKPPEHTAFIKELLDNNAAGSTDADQINSLMEKHNIHEAYVKSFARSCPASCFDD